MPTFEGFLPGYIEVAKTTKIMKSSAYLADRKTRDCELSLLSVDGPRREEGAGGELPAERGGRRRHEGRAHEVLQLFFCDPVQMQSEKEHIKLAQRKRHKEEHE